MASRASIELVRAARDLGMTEQGVTSVLSRISLKLESVKKVHRKYRELLKRLR